MTRSERMWCLVYSGILVVLTTIPVWIGFAAEGDAWRFTGFVIGVEDGNSYIAKMLLGQGGAWLFRTPYTGMEQHGVLAFLPFLLLGKLASAPALHLQLAVLYHLFRIATIPLVVMATYRLAAVFLPGEGQRRWGTVLATAGGGLGWAMLLVSGSQSAASLPLEYISPESFGFLALYTLPHLALTRALMLIALTTYLQSNGRMRAGWEAGLILMISLLVQPLTALTCLAVIGAHQLLLFWRGRTAFSNDWNARWRPVLWRMLIPILPFLVYYIIAFSTDPFLKLWSAQNQLQSPPPGYYLLAFGLLLPFSIVGIVTAWCQRDPDASLLTAWILIFPLLAYFPYPVQRRLPEGVWVAFSILAIKGFADLLRRQRVFKLAMPFVVSISMISSGTLIMGGAAVASRPARPMFRTSADVAAYTWLADHAQPGDLVLASYATGNALPAWAGVRVLIGLGPESANLQALEPEVKAFYNGEWTEEEQASFVKLHDIGWIILGPEERDLGGKRTILPAEWQIEYDDDGYQIFRTGESP